MDGHFAATPQTGRRRGTGRSAAAERVDTVHARAADQSGTHRPDSTVALKSPLSRLLEPRSLPVPLLGAGISASAGMPLGAELAAWILRSESAVGVDFSSLPEPGARTDPLHVSQFLIDARSEVAEPLRRAVHQHFVERSAAATLTPLLLHLARTPGRLIVTLNYDDLIERAAEAQRIPVRSLTRDDIASVIAAPLPRGDDPLQRRSPARRHPHRRDVRARSRWVRARDVERRYRRSVGHDDDQRAFCLLGTSFEEPDL